MFQTFDDIGGPEHGAERVRLLRKELEKRGLSGFLLPRSDEFQNEYVAPEAEQLLWLTGFSGSWGIVAILMENAALFVDGRYTLQASKQIDLKVFEVVYVGDKSLTKWLKANLKPGDRIGYDPHLHTVSQVEGLTGPIDEIGAELVPVEPNPLAKIWTDRPTQSPQPIELHPIAFAGVEAREKLANIQSQLAKHKRDAVIIVPLDCIAWLFNIRGQDYPHTPFVRSYAIVPVEGKAQLFIDGSKLTPDVREGLTEIAEISEPSEIAESLDALGRRQARVQLDPARASQWHNNRLTAAGATVIHDEDPCILPKARKNTAEIAGARAAHLRDGTAMCQFLAWFEQAASSGELDEIGVAKKLEDFRRASNMLRDVSFDTIAATGSNGAIVHYRPIHSTNRTVEPGDLFLIDSGGQYQDGTTDITRTVAIGEPTPEMRRHYTLVLKGHIAIATARFPRGTRGIHLDVLARRALWNAGLDYGHGTGHGVGSFLSVHEGPQSISKRDSVELEPGMIISNEPGYYRTCQYGIRIENLILVLQAEDIPGGDQPMMSFETLMFVPFDRRLIEPSLLTPDEADWIDTYHQTVFAKHNLALDGGALEWLRNATAPLERSGR